MSARDELAHIVESVDQAAGWDVSPDTYAMYADAILAWVEEKYVTKPRTINTVEELDSLIAESVVRSEAGIVYERYADEDGPEFDYWLIPGEQRAQAALKIDLPATVLFDPESSDG